MVVYLCVLPAVKVVISNSGSVSPLENPLAYMALLLSIGAALMQGIADIQMHKFRKNRNGAFIRVGLWKYSRHPNYLGEILMWWGIGLSVVFASPTAWYLLVCALANTALFLAVSIPMADKRQSRKDGFDEYKKQTRMLLPIKKF